MDGTEVNTLIKNVARRLTVMFLLVILFGWMAEQLIAQPPDAVLPGTERLTMEGDLSMDVLHRMDAYVTGLIERSPETRDTLWHREYSSLEAYIQSVEPNRERFRKMIGLVDDRAEEIGPEFVITTQRPSLIAENDAVTVYEVRWPVQKGLCAEGLLLEPRQSRKAMVVALPEADWQPEDIAGLTGALPPPNRYALRLAESGCMVLVPVVINRAHTWSGVPEIAMTNMTHREWLYRQAYFMGRHIIGYEVQKILAAVDFFETESDLPVGVAGYGEGGLLALYAAAADTRIDAAWVSGYYQEREQAWQEPVYRNVYGLLQEFGDAGIASLVAPRGLIIEACQGPETRQPEPLTPDDWQYAAPGELHTPPLQSVRREYREARQYYRKLGVADGIQLVVSSGGTGDPGTTPSLEGFLAQLGITDSLGSAKESRASAAGQAGSAEPFQPSLVPDWQIDTRERMKCQVKGMQKVIQDLMYASPLAQQQFWADADRSSVETWVESTERYRQYFHDEIIGHMPPIRQPLHPRTRVIYKTDRFTGYEVVLDLWPETIAYGILLVPNDIADDEKRPVVVAQHGRGGRPQDVATPYEDTKYYHGFGARLAERGFVVYAPQNLFIGEEEYRTLQRKCNLLKMTFFAPMVDQHQRQIDWLSRLPFVDPERIGFYGLSYGGKSAMMIPPVVTDYALSISSGDFTNTVRKHIGLQFRNNFIFTNEHEHTEFDLGGKFNYSRLAGLIAPRPFMVERGLLDIGIPNKWVAYEYAKVRELYLALGIYDRTEIEFFVGQHEINMQGTFDFLHKHLDWQEPGTADMQGQEIK